MKQFTARRTPDGPWVQVDGEDLQAVQADGQLSVSAEEAFDWGYSGSGPSRLALAILFHIFHDLPTAKMLRDSFLKEVIAQKPEEGFTLTIEELRKWIQGKVGRMKFRLTGNDDKEETT